MYIVCIYFLIIFIVFWLYCDIWDWFCVYGKLLVNENGNLSRFKIMNDFFKDVKDNVKGLRIYKKMIKKYIDDVIEFIVGLLKKY